jgi:hypothetical protein
MKTMENINFFYNERILDFMIESYNRDFQIILSKQFVRCAEKQLRKDFETKTKLKVSSRVQMCNSPSGSMILDMVSGISKIPYSVWIASNWNPVIVAWKSRSGRIYTMGDEDIDCNDIEFWFEGLNPALYLKQLYPKVGLPFKLKPLSFDLVLTRICHDCVIEMHFKESQQHAYDDIINHIDNCIENFNVKSEKARKFVGVVHNWKRQINQNGLLVYELDLGSAELVFFKHLLYYLSELGCFSKVEIC